MLAVVVPSFALDAPRVEAIKGMLQAEGVPFRFFGPALASSESALYASSAIERAEALRSALTDPEVTVVWAARGGSGGASLLPYLPSPDLLFAPRPDGTPPPVLAGYSDITALHLWAGRAASAVTLHTSTLSELALRPPSDADDIKRLVRLCGTRALSRPEIAAEIRDISGVLPLNAAAEATGDLYAPLAGGNQTLLQCALGTSWACRTEGVMLLLEDWDEPLYAYERRAEQMMQAGMFLTCACVLFGDTSLKEGGTEAGERAVRELAAQLTVPAFRIPRVGHCGHNAPLLLHAPASLVRHGTDSSRTLSFR